MIYKIFIFKYFLLVNPSKILSLKYTYIKEKILNVKIVKNYISAVKVLETREKYTKYRRSPKKRGHIKFIKEQFFNFISINIK